MITTTLADIKRHQPCKDGWTKLLTHLGKTKADDELLPLAVILTSNGLGDALWALRTTPDGKQVAVNFANACAKRATSYAAAAAAAADAAAADAAYADAAARYAAAAAADAYATRYAAADAAAARHAAAAAAAYAAAYAAAAVGYAAARRAAYAAARHAADAAAAYAAERRNQRAHLRRLIK